MDDQKIIIKELQEARSDLKHIQSDLVDMKVIQGKNQVILQEHMKRTTANEERLQRLEDFKWYFAGIAVLMTVAVEIFRKIY